jgi:hypothetical protein
VVWNGTVYLYTGHDEAKGNQMFNMNDWSGLDRVRTESATDVLLSLRWLEERSEATAGRTRTVYAINPKIKIAVPGEVTQLTEAPSGSSVGT